MIILEKNESKVQQESQKSNDKEHHPVEKLQMILEDLFPFFY